MAYNKRAGTDRELFRREVLRIADQIAQAGPGGGSGGDASATKQDEQTALLTTIDTDTSTLAGAVAGNELQVDVVSSSLPSGAATAASITDNLGTAASAAATSNTGSFSVISFIKRFLSHYLATRTYFANSFAASGDNTVIAAPAAGTRIVITGLRIQGTSGTATTVLIKSGASTTLARLRTVADGSGFDAVYGPSNALRLAAAQAFIVNLSGANAHSVSVQYYVETVSTGLPV